MSLVERRLAELGLTLPPPWTPRGAFAPYRLSGSTVFLSGQINEWAGAVTLHGPVENDESSIADAVAAARVCALNLLYCLRDACGGNLDRVSGIIRVGGFVACEPSFPWSPRVVDGATLLFRDLFGERGVHARTAVGVAGLPGNAAVEIDAIVEIATA